MTTRGPNSRSRFMYPEHSVPWQLHVPPEDPQKVFDELPKPKDNEPLLRDTFLNVGVIQNAKGSAYMEFGKTKLIVAVHTPREMQDTNAAQGDGILKAKVTYAPYSSKDVTEDFVEKGNQLAVSLIKAFNPIVCRNEFPNLQLDLEVFVIEDDGCVLSTAINCCSAALMHACISCYDVLTASTICLYRGYEFLNPTATVEHLLSNITLELAQEEHGLVISTTLNEVENQISENYQYGCLSLESWQRLTQRCCVMNQQMFKIIEQVIEEHVKQRHEEYTEKLALLAKRKEQLDKSKAENAA